MLVWRTWAPFSRFIISAFACQCPFLLHCGIAHCCVRGVVPQRWMPRLGHGWSCCTVLATHVHSCSFAVSLSRCSVVGSQVLPRCALPQRGSTSARNHKGKFSDQPIFLAAQRSRGHIQIHCSLAAGVVYTLEGVLQPVAEGDLSAAAFFDDTSQTTLTTLSQAITLLFCCLISDKQWLADH